jgi:hypothetical protein
MAPKDLYLRTVTARCVVEMMEQEWPRNWADLFPQFQRVVADPCLLPQSQMVFKFQKIKSSDFYDFFYRR